MDPFDDEVAPTENSLSGSLGHSTETDPQVVSERPSPVYSVPSKFKSSKKSQPLDLPLNKLMVVQRKPGRSRKEAPSQARGQHGNGLEMLFTSTTSRFPVLPRAVVATPGPGSYNPSLPASDPSKGTMGSVTQARSKPSHEFRTGPGSYGSADFTPHGPSFRIGGRPQATSPSRTPGPGTYSTTPTGEPQCPASLGSPAMSFLSALSGPASAGGAEGGDGQTCVSDSVAGTFGHSERVVCPVVSSEGVPGPGTYDVRRFAEQRKPNHSYDGEECEESAGSRAGSMGRPRRRNSRLFTSIKSSTWPGPGSYDPRPQNFGPEVSIHGPLPSPWILSLGTSRFTPGPGTYTLARPSKTLLHSFAPHLMSCPPPSSFPPCGGRKPGSFVAYSFGANNGKAERK